MQQDRVIVCNCATQYRKPFTARTIMQLTGIPEARVKPILVELERNDRIKRISREEDIYVRMYRYGPAPTAIGPTPWPLNLEKANHLLDVLEKQAYTSVREIGAAMGYSRQWVYVYLEALASLDMVVVENDYYVVKSRAKLPFLGSVVRKGILGQMKGYNHPVKPRV
jgi:DNA-binding IclR family transcriptional regulator